MILSSKAISVHICSKLCMVAFLSSISARYFHTIGVSSMFDAHFSCNYQHAPKDRKVTRHINVLFISKCIFPPFLQHTRKDRKIRPGPPVSRRRTFLSFPGLLYIYNYTYIYIHISSPIHTNTTIWDCCETIILGTEPRGYEPAMNPLETNHIQ